MAQCMLSTTSNPYNPFTSFDIWLAEDQRLAIQENRPTCCAYFDRVMPVGSEVSDAEYEQVCEDVIDEIVQLNLSGNFRKVTPENAKELGLVTA